MFNRLKDKKGISLMLFLALLLMLTLIGVVAINNSLTNIDISYNRGKTSNLLYSAEAGIEKAFAEIKYYYDHHDTVMNPVPSALPHGTFALGKDSVSYYTYCDSATTLSGGCSDWLSGWRRTAVPFVFRNISAWSNGYLVISEAWTPGNPRKVRIKQQIAIYHVPAFAFAAFFDTFDLEISPEHPTGGAIPYNISGQGGGGIHSNRNIYLEAPTASAFHDRLELRARVTAKGAIYHGHNPTYTGTWPSGSNFAWGASNSIFMADAIGNLQNMIVGADTLDHSNPNWVYGSLTRWGGTVEDSAHMISDLNLKMVLPVGNVPRDIIGRGLGNPVSLENDADLKIWAQVNATKFGCTTVRNARCDTGTGEFICTPNIFNGTIVTEVGTYDYREADTVRCYQLDMGALIASGLYPDNGIIYITRDTCGSPPINSFFGIMIINADSLPQPTTIVSNLPVYIVGNFNLDWPAPFNSHPAAAIIADAVTILADTMDRKAFFDSCLYPWEWDNTTPLMTNPTLNWRVVIYPQTVNACIMAGIIPTTASNYSGGLWNLARLLEHWNSISLTINGSMACFWESQVADSAYQFPDNAGMGSPGVYTRPRLNLTYDASLTNSGPALQPPGTPKLNITVKIKRSVEEL